MSDAEVRPKKARKLDVRGLAIAGLAALALIGWQQFSGNGGASGYSCDSLVSQIVSLSDENKSALIPIKIIDIVDTKTHSTAKDRVECSGIAMLSTGVKMHINYRAYVEYDKWWIKSDPLTSI